MLLVEYKHVPKNKMRIKHCPVDPAKTETVNVWAQGCSRQAEKQKMALAHYKQQMGASVVVLLLRSNFFLS